MLRALCAHSMYMCARAPLRAHTAGTIPAQLVPRSTLFSNEKVSAWLLRGKRGCGEWSAECLAPGVCTFTAQR